MATTTACIDAPHHDAARDTARFLDELRTIVGELRPKVGDGMKG
jgi:hypothetical protein